MSALQTLMITDDVLFSRLPPFRGRFFNDEAAEFPSWEGNCASLREADFKKPTPESRFPQFQILRG